MNLDSQKGKHFANGSLKEYIMLKILGQIKICLTNFNSTKTL